MDVRLRNGSVDGQPMFSGGSALLVGAHHAVGGSLPWALGSAAHQVLVRIREGVEGLVSVAARIQWCNAYAALIHHHLGNDNLSISKTAAPRRP